MVISYSKDAVASSVLNTRNTYSNAIILQYACLVATHASHVWKYIKPKTGGLRLKF